MFSKRAAYLIPSGLGIVAGVVTSLIIGQVGRHTAKSPPAPAAEIDERPSGADDARLAALEGRVGALALARVQSAPAPARESEAEPAADRPVLTAEERRQLTAKHIADADRRFTADPVDPVWTRKATTQLTTTITTVGEKLGYKVVDSECRTQYCRATLRWSDATHAQERGRHLAEMTIPGLNCAQTSWVPDPEPGASEQTTKLFLDCAELRAGTADNI